MKFKSPLFIIFTTVLIDLIGFGMVIPLIGIYGRHYGASGASLSVLGGIYSLMQFIFAPFWGILSDRIGRRPVLLFSLAGSTLSYVMFAYAPNYEWLIFSRAFGGICAANISTAQAYIADITTPENRAKGMGLIGAAFGIGFTFGPPLGGISVAKLGLAAPGLIAATVCGLNFFLAIHRLPESFPKNLRMTKKVKFIELIKNPFNLKGFHQAFKNNDLRFFLLQYFFYVFSFSTMEQTFSLLFQEKFNLDLGMAGYKTGLVLMGSGLIGAIIQGGLIRKLVPLYGERKLLTISLAINMACMLAFPWIPEYRYYFLLSIPMAFASGLFNPNISSLISKSVSSKEQGLTMGLSQGLGSLARALGPFCGLMTFSIHPAIPYGIAGGISGILCLLCIYYFKAHRLEQNQ